MARETQVNPSEEIIRHEIAIDVILWANEYAVTLAKSDEMAASAAVNLLGKHLAKYIMETRCYKPSSFPLSSD